MHSVPWFTARLGGALVELSGSRPDLTLTEVLAEAISRTADAHRVTCELSHARTPQATVVLARWGAETVEHLVLSDSALLVEAYDSTVRAVLDDRLDRLPPGSLASNEIADATVRNKEGGFFTAAADPSVASRAVTGSTPVSGVRALAALSDGATRWTEVFGEGDWADVLGLLRKAGPRGADRPGTGAGVGRRRFGARTAAARQDPRRRDGAAGGAGLTALRRPCAAKARRLRPGTGPGAGEAGRPGGAGPRARRWPGRPPQPSAWLFSWCRSRASSATSAWSQPSLSARSSPGGRPGRRGSGPGPPR